jgi:uncharacterized DUF497 family protein
MPITFTWDRRKSAVNERKHKTTFEEAITVFNDPREIMMPDPEHSDNEERFVSIGLSERGRLITVVYTETEEAIRIISARPASRLEQSQYADSR